MPANSLLEAALAYARAGWRVLPLHNVELGGCSCGRPRCRPGGVDEKSIAKHPRTRKWQEDATTNESMIRLWWLQWPRANIGIATGAASNVLVLDVDVHRNAPGIASLMSLEAQLGPLTRTKSARTGSGGQHRLFRFPHGIAICNSAGWRGAAGIDWRGDGGQIVVAPSIALAGAYQWTDLSEVAELPPRWVEAHREYETLRAQRRSALTRSRPKSASGEADDDAVIANLKSAGNAEKFLTLWTGSWLALGYESQSNADLALCSIISFWCDPDDPAPDPERIDRIFRRSELYRDKWERDDYREKTILMAVEMEEARRKSDASIREHIMGSALPPAPPTHDEIVAHERARLQASVGTAPAPQTPVISIRTADVLAQIRKIVRKKRNAKSAKAKLDGDMTENFMAGEELITPAEISRTPTLIAFGGDVGRRRVAWLLGSNLPSSISWDAIANARPQFMRVPQAAGDLLAMSKNYVEAQVARQQWDAKKEKEKETEKAAFRERVRRFYAGKAK